MKTLQKRLNLMADGIFGKLTEEAVREFQKAHSLTADGIAGAKTLAALGIGGYIFKEIFAESLIVCIAAVAVACLTEQTVPAIIIAAAMYQPPGGAVLLVVHVDNHGSFSPAGSLM